MNPAHVKKDGTSMFAIYPYNWLGRNFIKLSRTIGDWKQPQKRLWPLLWCLLACTLLFPQSTIHAQGDLLTVRVLINSTTHSDCSDDIFSGPPDIFFRVLIDGLQTNSFGRPIEKESPILEINLEFVEKRDSKSTIPIIIQQWNDNPSLESELCDIDPGPDKELNFVINYPACTISGDVSGNCNTPILSDSPLAFTVSIDPPKGKFDLPNFQWRSNGPIDGMRCVQINEENEPELTSWPDNYLCMDFDFGMEWSSHGPIDNKYCVQWYEGREPAETTWQDNYLCFAPYLVNWYSFAWSSSGPIEGMQCTQIHESLEIAGHGWDANYFCVKLKTEDDEWFVLQAYDGSYIGLDWAFNKLLVSGKYRILDALPMRFFVAQESDNPLEGNIFLEAKDEVPVHVSPSSVSRNLRADISGADISGSNRRFTIVPLGGGEIALRASDGKYVRLVKSRGKANIPYTTNSFLEASGVEPTADAQFKIVHIAAFRGRAGCDERPGIDEVILYEHADFAGDCTTLQVEDYIQPSQLLLPNDSVSSIRVGPTVMVRLCRDQYFEGNCESLIADDSNLTDNFVGNDAVSSIRVTAKTKGDELLCRGDLWSVSRDTALDLLQNHSSITPEQLLAIGPLAFVGVPAVAVFFDKPDYQGDSWVFVQGRDEYLNDILGDSLGKKGWGDHVESMLYFGRPGILNTTTALQIFDDDTYRAGGLSAPLPPAKDEAAFCGTAAVDNFKGEFKDITGLGANGMSSLRFLSLFQYQPCGGYEGIADLEDEYDSVEFGYEGPFAGLPLQINTLYWPLCEHWFEITEKATRQFVGFPCYMTLFDSNGVALDATLLIINIKDPCSFTTFYNLEPGKYRLLLPEQSQFGYNHVRMTVVDPPPPRPIYLKGALLPFIHN